MIKTIVIFGGTGFIGSHFTKFLIDNNLADKIYLFDLKPPNKLFNFDTKIVKYIRGDVRNPIPVKLFSDNILMVINLAAIHREPGHIDSEYFETNLLGADNICHFLDAVHCKNLIFTSSISPYGLSEAIKDETTVPCPATPYGCSKLVAEKIHQIWQAKDIKSRRLVIVRPGVVFGPGEGGNVSRLIKSVIGRYFFFVDNHSTRKAGIYVKELCNAMWWVSQEQNKNGETVSLFNASMNPSPSISEYIKAICKVRGIKRFIPNLPFRALIVIAHLIEFITKPLGISHPFSPIRIQKLVRSNNIFPLYLMVHNYHFQYSLEVAFNDWKKDRPEEWK